MDRMLRTLLTRSSETKKLLEWRDSGEGSEKQSSPTGDFDALRTLACKTPGVYSPGGTSGEISGRREGMEIEDQDYHEAYSRIRQSENGVKMLIDSYEKLALSDEQKLQLTKVKLNNAEKSLYNRKKELDSKLENMESKKRIWGEEKKSLIEMINKIKRKKEKDVDKRKDIDGLLERINQLSGQIRGDIDSAPQLYESEDYDRVKDASVRYYDNNVNDIYGIVWKINNKADDLQKSVREWYDNGIQVREEWLDWYRKKYMLDKDKEKLNKARERWGNDWLVLVRKMQKEGKRIDQLDKQMFNLGKKESENNKKMKALEGQSRKIREQMEKLDEKMRMIDDKKKSINDNNMQLKMDKQHLTRAKLLLEE
jgi:chromosome segregation ATPase